MMSIDQGKRVLRIEAQAILDLVKRLDKRFTKAVDLMYRCTGKVVVTGMGKSGLIGKKIAATLASTGTPALFLHSAEGVHGDLGMLSRGDVVIAISNSGETEEIVKLLHAIKRIDVRLISLTGNIKSTLAKNSDVVLDVSVKEEACSLGLAPTASTTATLAMGDALAIVLLEKRGFKEQDFAAFHPGGVLGRRLLLKVEDVMQSGKQIPRVTEETPMKDVIVEITSKKLGMTTVTDSSGRIRGVVTDGDLRRLLEKQLSDLLKMPAKQVMSTRPKVIHRTALAAEAVQRMEAHSITALVVVDAQGLVEGVIHLHDLLKIGIV
jgi:arabinose-5-phosphate isomerase